MDYYAGIDVSLESASVCVVDRTGNVVREGKVASTPEALIAWFLAFGQDVARIGLEAGPLSQWLYAGLRSAGLEAELISPTSSALNTRSPEFPTNVVAVRFQSAP